MMNPMQNGQHTQHQYSPQMHHQPMPMGGQQRTMMTPMNAHHHSPQMHTMNAMGMNQMGMYQNNPMLNNQQQHNQRYGNNMSNMMMNRSNTQSNQHNTNSQQHNNQNSGNNQNNPNNKGPTKDTWISPFKNREQNIDFFMYAYKCQPCPLRRNCQSKVTCPGWHHEGEKRRNPGEHPNYHYSEEPCPNVKPQGTNKWQPPSRCSDGDECGYSHTLLEQMYHPNIYKTSMCINFTNPQGNKCQWGYYCTHAHGQEDIRNPNKKTNSNENNNSAQNTNTNDKSLESLKKDSATNNDNKDTQTSNHMLLDKKKMDLKRLRSQSAQSNLAGYQGNSDPNLYSNGGHMRSPQFMTSSHSHSHNLNPNHLPPPNMQYNSYNSPPQSTNDQSPNNTMSHNTSSPPRGNINSHRADFSPVPYTAAAARQYAANAPPQLNLHDPASMYHHHGSSTSHHSHTHHQQAPYTATQDASYYAYQHRKRGRSISADTGLVPYLGNKASAQPNLYPRYPSHDALQSHHYPPPTIHSNEEIPAMPPTLGDGTRVSQTFHPQQMKGMATTSATKPEPVGNKDVNTNNTNNSPPPPNAEQVKNNPHNFLLNRDITFQDSSLLAPPRAVRSRSGGNLMYASNSGGNPTHSFLGNTDNLTGVKIKGLTASSSLPSRVAELPKDKLIVFAKTPADLDSRRRNRSESEPLHPPKYTMMSDSIWKTNPNQDAPGGSNPNIKITAVPKHPSAPTNSKDPFQKRLTAMPENNATLAGVFSPDSQFNIDNIITPRDMKSPEAGKQNTNKDASAADWNYFGFSQEDILSPVPSTDKNKKGINVPKTPPPPVSANSAKSNSKNKEEEIRRLKKQLEAAAKTIDKLSKLSKDKPSLGSATKKSVVVKKPNDDEKEPMKKKDVNDALQQQQLARYKHFITCPACNIFDRQTPRNQVCVPCGHLICGKCSSSAKQKDQKCPICTKDITNFQLLRIG